MPSMDWLNPMGQDVRMPADNSQEQVRVEPLVTWARWAAGLLGLSLVALAIASIVLPFATSYEWGSGGAIDKSARNASDLATFATTALVAGAALFAYAINGVRLVRLGVGSVAIEGNPTVDAAKEHQSRPPADSVGEVELPEEDDVRPVEQPAAELVTRDGTVGVFELKDVPARVIRDALEKWPASVGSPPDSLGEFQFATRKRGKGPHPWILKFQSKPEVRVFYGGRSKSGATVKQN